MTRCFGLEKYCPKQKCTIKLVQPKCNFLFTENLTSEQIIRTDLDQMIHQIDPIQKSWIFSMSR